jgi:hypothetical protein
MATIQSTTNTTVNTQPLPAATSKGTDSANATEATAKGVVASATQISVSVSSGAEDWLVSPVAYGLGQNPPLSGEAASQALNQFFTELQTLPSSQKEILLNDLMNFLLDAFRLFKKSNMQTRAAELTNQYQATLASADKLMQAAKETKNAGVATAVFGIIAGGLSIGTAGMGFRSTLNSSKLVSQYKVNNQEITAKTNQLQTLPKKPAVDGTGANAGAQSKSAMRTEIKNLNDAQSTLTRQIDLGNSQAQALTQGGTAAAGFINSIGGAVSTEANYQAQLSNAESKQKDAEAQKASANADTAKNFLDSAQSNFSSTIQNLQSFMSSYNNRVQAGIKAMA